jgi:YVTN family beta-propeller protein
VAITPNGANAYVTDYGSGSVSGITTATNTVTTTITVGSEPLCVAVAPNGANAYVTNYGSNTVSVINLAPTGSAVIPTGTDVPVSISVANSVVTFIFSTVTASGQISVTITSSYPPPPTEPSVGTAAPSVTRAYPGFLGVWRVTVTAKYTGPVSIGIYYGNLGSTPTQILQSEAVPGDVNFDGKVNLADLLIITKALGSTPGTPRWNPNCDLNGDGKVTLQDLGIALQNFGKTGNPAWIPLSSITVDTTDSIISGTTTQFSLFGVR